MLYILCNNVMYFLTLTGMFHPQVLSSQHPLLPKYMPEDKSTIYL